jgi:UDP-N-acetylglucosamine 2-epimerase (non-hydrolysing)
LLFTTEPAGEHNLLNEGVEASRIHYVGNVMIDTLLSNVSKTPDLLEVFNRHGVTQDIDKGDYAVLTMHRPSNVDDPEVLHSLVASIQKVAESLPLIFAVHPRTEASLGRNGLFDVLKNNENIYLLPPLEYLDLLVLMKHAKMVLTDSGGLQEETTALGVPCITLRENTERPATVDEGTNTIVGTSDELIQKTVQNILKSGGKSGCVPKYWDGKAAERIASVIKEWMN